MTDSTSREIRVRVGGGLRLEATLPKALTAAQLAARRSRIEELAALLRPLAKDNAHIGQGLLAKLARARHADAEQLERAVRRFIREPAEAGAAAVAVANTKTFREFGMHWATNGFAKDCKRTDNVRVLEPDTVKSNLSRMRNLPKAFLDLPLVSITKADCDSALEHLPETVEAESSVRHFAQVIQRVLRLAVHPANIIAPDKYPLPLRWLPSTGTPPSYPILYPADVVMLLRCPGLPAWRRMLYAFAIYEGMRLSHMLRLRYSNVDWANGRITIGVGKNNKNARTWKLNAGTLAALSWFKGEADMRDHIFPRLTSNETLKLAEGLRDDLTLAGVTRDVRPDVYHSGDGQEPLRFQDLRATFVSLHLAMGWSEVDVMMRTQHTSTKVLHHHYARRLGLAKGIIEDQGPLPPMDLALGLEVKPSKSAQRTVAALLGRVGKAPAKAKGGGKGGGVKRVKA